SEERQLEDLAPPACHLPRRVRLPLARGGSLGGGGGYQAVRRGFPLDRAEGSSRAPHARRAALERRGHRGGAGPRQRGAGRVHLGRASAQDRGRRRRPGPRRALRDDVTRTLGMPTVVLFDVDGTLIDSGGAGARSWAHAFDKLYGISADIGSHTAAGETDPVLARKTFDAAAGRGPSGAEPARPVAV